MASKFTPGVNNSILGVNKSTPRVDSRKEVHSRSNLSALRLCSGVNAFAPGVNTLVNFR